MIINFFSLNQIKIVLILIQTSLNYVFLLSSQSNTIVQTKLFNLKGWNNSKQRI